MDLLTIVKESLSIIQTATAKDNELNMWIESAKLELARQGIEVDLSNNLVVSAIVLYVKGTFGNVDIKEKELALKTYNLMCQNLGLSKDYKEGDSNA